MSANSFILEEDTKCFKDAMVNASQVIVRTTQKDKNLAGGWARGQSRCLQCSKLVCDCPHAHIDQGKTKKALENVEMNTPFAKAKMLKTLKGVTESEVKQRSAADVSERAEREGIRAQFECGSKLMSVQCLEGSSRCALAAQRTKEMAETESARNNGVVRIGLLIEEGKVREALRAEEENVCRNIQAQHNLNRAGFTTQNREDAERKANISNEQAQRAEITILFRQEEMRVNEGLRLRKALGESEVDSRHRIAAEFKDGVEGIILKRAHFFDALAKQEKDFARERESAISQTEESKREVMTEEKADFVSIKTQFKKERADLLQVLDAREQQVVSAIKEEAGARAVVQKSECEALSSIRAIVAEHLTLVEAAYVAKAQKRSALLKEHERLAKAIAAQEEEDRRVLADNYRREAKLRQQWIVSKQDERKAFAKEFDRTVEEVIFASEAKSRKNILAEMKTEKPLVERWMKSKLEERRSLSNAAESFIMDECHTEEVCERNALKKRMVDGAKAIEQGLVRHFEDRAAMCDSEYRARSYIISQDQEAFRSVVAAATSERAMMEERRRTFAALLESAAAAEIESRRRIQELEGQEVAQLSINEDADRQFAVNLCHIHEQGDLEKASYSEMNNVMLCEEAEWYAILKTWGAKMQLASQRIVDHFKFKESLVFADESRQRDDELANECEEYATFAEEFNAGLVAAQRLQAVREGEERAQRQVQMTEDGRMYDEDEAPLPDAEMPCGRMSLAVFMKSAPQDNSAQKYVEEILNVDCSGIGMRAFNIAEWLDFAREQALTHAEEAQKAEVLAMHLSKQCEKIQTERKAYRESIAYYKAKATSDLADHKQRLANEKTHTARERQNLLMEEQRTKTEAGNLARTKEACAVVRDELHSQMGMRPKTAPSTTKTTTTVATKTAVKAVSTTAKPTAVTKPTTTATQPKAAVAKPRN